MAQFKGPIIVTGGAGFLGANLVAHLLAGDERADILVIDDCRSGGWANLLEACRRAHVPRYPGDFLVDNACEIEWMDFLEDIDPSVVFHFAGADRPASAVAGGGGAGEQRLLWDNIEGFRGLLYACLEFGTPLVYASSAGVYGGDPSRAGEAASESAGGDPCTAPGFAKWIMENIHRQAVALRDAGDPPAHVVGLRFFEVFGPGETCANRVPSLAHLTATRRLAGEAPELPGGESAGRDMLSVRDAVACAVAAAARGAPGGVYNCGSGQVTTNADLLAALGEGIGEARREPARGACGDAPPAPLAGGARADLSKVKRHLKWRPAHDVRDALHAFAASLAEAPEGLR